MLALPFRKEKKLYWRHNIRLLRCVIHTFWVISL